MRSPKKVGSVGSRKRLKVTYSTTRKGYFTNAAGGLYNLDFPGNVLTRLRNLGPCIRVPLKGSIGGTIRNL